MAAVAADVAVVRLARGGERASQSSSMPLLASEALVAKAAAAKSIGGATMRLGITVLMMLRGLLKIWWPKTRLESRLSASMLMRRMSARSSSSKLSYAEMIPADAEARTRLKNGNQRTALFALVFQVGRYVSVAEDRCGIRTACFSILARRQMADLFIAGWSSALARGPSVVLWSAGSPATGKASVASPIIAWD